MIKHEYTDTWRLIARLAIDWPFTQEEVYSALEKEQYYGDEDRTYCPHPVSPILQEILNIVNSSIPNLLLDMTRQYDFKHKWCLEYEDQLINNTKTTCMFTCDKPGYIIDTHVDSRLQVCTGMIFFNNFDDPDQATTFYTSHSGDNPLRMSSQYGSGWYAANTHDCWHTGANNTQRNRYAIIFINKLDLK
jgi:hypothetical protein